MEGGGRTSKRKNAAQRVREHDKGGGRMTGKASEEGGRKKGTTEKSKSDGRKETLEQYEPIQQTRLMEEVNMCSEEPAEVNRYPV